MILYRGTVINAFPAVRVLPADDGKPKPEILAPRPVLPATVECSHLQPTDLFLAAGAGVDKPCALRTAAPRRDSS